MAQDALFKPFTVSIMLDSNGSNTTAVAAVVKIEQAMDTVKGKRVVVVAGTGPVGQRVAGLLGQGGAKVVITSRKPEQGEKARRSIGERFEIAVEITELSSPDQASKVLDKADILVNAGPAGVMMVPKAAWFDRGVKVVVDFNAVAPVGVEGVELNDAGEKRGGAVVFGAFGVGNFKTKLHKRCVARLFEKNDLVLDAEGIADIAREMLAGS
jgi:shikimate 5-dehydrogenase